MLMRPKVKSPSVTNHVGFFFGLSSDAFVDQQSAALLAVLMTVDTTESELLTQPAAGYCHCLPPVSNAGLC